MSGQNYKNRGITVEFSNPGDGDEKPKRSERRGKEKSTEKPTRESKRATREKDKEVMKQLKEIKTAKKAAKKEKATKTKPSREERGYTKPRGRKDDWMQFFMQDNDLKGDVPNFDEGGWAKKSKKKK